MRFARFSALGTLLCALLVSGCSNNNSRPNFQFDNLQIDIQCFAGEIITIQYTDDDSDNVARVSLFADVDGNLATTGDRFTIATFLPENNGLPQAFNWNTAGIPAGVYRIVAFVADFDHEFTVTAPGQVTIASLAISAPVPPPNPLIRMVLAGGTAQIDYTDNDPDDTATTDIFADADGNLATTGDQICIAKDRPQGGGTLQTVHWNTAGAATDTYWIMLRATKGAKTFTVTSTGSVTVNNVQSVSPADMTVLPGTTFNVRVRFDLSLTNALNRTINSSTFPITVAGDTEPGSYTLENGNTEINFEHDNCVFPAGETINVDINSDLLHTSTSAGTVFSSTFDTTVTPVFAFARSSTTLSVVDAVGLTEANTIALDADDMPFFGTGKSDGTIFITSRGDTEEEDTDGYVICIDGVNQTRTGQINLQKVDEGKTLFAAGVALSPDETELYVAGYEGDSPGDSDSIPFLAIINCATRTQITRITLNNTGRVRDLAISPDGTRAYIPNADNQAFHVVNLTTRQELDADGVLGNGVSPKPILLAFGTDFEAGGAAVSADGSTLYISFGGADGESTSDIAVFDTTTLVEGVPLETDADAGAGAPSLLFDPCTNRLYAPNTPDDDEGLTVFTPFDPVGTVVDGVGNGDVVRDVALVWGVNLVALAARGSEVAVVDAGNLGAGGSGVGISNTGQGVATIPPTRN